MKKTNKQTKKSEKKRERQNLDLHMYNTFSSDKFWKARDL